MIELIFRIVSVFLVILGLDSELDEMVKQVIYGVLMPCFDGELVLNESRGIEWSRFESLVGQITDYILMRLRCWMVLIHLGLYITPSLYRYEWYGLWVWIRWIIGLSSIGFRRIHEWITSQVWLNLDLSIGEDDQGNRISLPVSMEIPKDLRSSRRDYCSSWLILQKTVLWIRFTQLLCGSIFRSLVPYLSLSNLASIRNLVRFRTAAMFLVFIYPLEALDNPYEGMGERLCGFYRWRSLIQYRMTVLRRCILSCDSTSLG